MSTFAVAWTIATGAVAAVFAAAGFASALVSDLAAGLASAFLATLAALWESFSI